jgi:hypothetical protein
VPYGESWIVQLGFQRFLKFVPSVVFSNFWNFPYFLNLIVVVVEQILLAMLVQNGNNRCTKINFYKGLP